MDITEKNPDTFEMGNDGLYVQLKMATGYKESGFYSYYGVNSQKTTTFLQRLIEKSFKIIE